MLTHFLLLTWVYSPYEILLLARHIVDIDYDDPFIAFKFPSSGKSFSTQYRKFLDTASFYCDIIAVVTETL